MPKTETIIKGTFLLTGAGLIVKLLGAVYRIPLARLIGSEGIGLYQMAYPVYLIFLSLSNAGIPIAISRIIAAERARGNWEGTRKVFRASLILVVILGVLSSGLMVLSAGWLAGHVVSDPRAVYPMWALAPAIFFISIIAAFRGYFQGWQDMGPSAVSQIVEQLVRVVVALALATLLLDMGIEHASAGAAFGATAGGAAGLVYLGIIYWNTRKERVEQKHLKGKPESMARIIKKLVRFALPISIAVVLMPLLQMLDSIVVPNRLQGIGYSVQQATSMLGILGNSWAVVYLPMIVTTAIASNLVPAMAGLKAQKAIPDLMEKIAEGLRLATLYLIPVSIIMGVMGPSIYRIIYSEGGVDVLSWFAPAVFFLGIQQVSAGILQGLGRPTLPLLNFCVGAFVKVLVTWLATGWPGLNLAGAAIGTVCGAGVTGLLNYWAVKRCAPIELPFKGAAVLAGGAMYIGSVYLKKMLTMPCFWEFVTVSGLGVAGYLAVLGITGGITVKDREVVANLIRKRRRA